MSRRLILASASPQRARLLEQLGLAFTAIAADIDEAPRPGETAEALVVRLAQTKAETLFVQYPRAVIIGADTLVVCGDQVFGKPADAAAAQAMLTALSGVTHRVVSGVAVLVGGVTKARLCSSQVTMRAISAAEIDAYWRSGEPRGKAGAYAIQGQGALFIEHLEGSYSAVMGLPLFETAALLRGVGIDVLESA
jgi:septum formation protein